VNLGVCELRVGWRVDELVNLGVCELVGELMSWRVGGSSWGVWQLGVERAS